MRGIGGEAHGLLKAAFEALHHLVEHADELRELAIIIAAQRNAFGEVAGGEALRGGDDTLEGLHRSFGGPQSGETGEGEGDDGGSGIPRAHAIHIRVKFTQREADEHGVVRIAEGSPAPVHAARAGGEHDRITHHGHLRAEAGGTAALLAVRRAWFQARQAEQPAEVGIAGFGRWWIVGRSRRGVAQLFLGGKTAAEVGIEIVRSTLRAEDGGALGMLFDDHDDGSLAASRGKDGIADGLEFFDGGAGIDAVPHALCLRRDAGIHAAFEHAAGIPPRRDAERGHERARDEDRLHGKADAEAAGGGRLAHRRGVSRQRRGHARR